MNRVLDTIRCLLRIHIPARGVEPSQSRLWCCDRCGVLVRTLTPMLVPVHRNLP